MIPLAGWSFSSRSFYLLLKRFFASTFEIKFTFNNLRAKVCCLREVICSVEIVKPHVAQKIAVKGVIHHDNDVLLVFKVLYVPTDLFQNDCWIEEILLDYVFVIETCRDLNFAADESFENLHLVSFVLRWIKFVDDLGCESSRWIFSPISRVSAVEYVAVGTTSDVSDAFQPGSFRRCWKLWNWRGFTARRPVVLVI